MSDDANKKYVSLTNYKALAMHLGKTKESVVADKDAGRLNIMDLESIVQYICEEKGWFFSKNTTAATTPQARTVPKDPIQNLKPTVRWEVTDHAKKIDDPYLERARVLKGR